MIDTDRLTVTQTALLESMIDLAEIHWDEFVTIFERHTAEEFPETVFEDMKQRLINT